MTPWQLAGWIADGLLFACVALFIIDMGKEVFRG